MAVQVPGDEAARDARQLQSHWTGLVGAGLFAGALLGSTALIFSQLAALDSARRLRTPPARGEPGGWLVVFHPWGSSDSMVYVPDADGAWLSSAVEAGR